MKYYHWFSSHPNEIDLSGGVDKMQTIGKELRIVDAKQTERPKQTDFRRISSVPDIWSQHRLFEMLLLNKAEDASYLEYEAIAKREWRAMLAILVLAESYGVTILSETIVFETLVGSPYLRAAYDARPNSKQWPSMEVYYVEANGVRYPIAMSSATVHIVPTKDAWRNLRMVYQGQIPWLTDNQVHSPVVEENGRIVPFKLGEKESEKTPAMMPVHALMLERWLERYQEKLASQQKALTEQIAAREKENDKKSEQEKAAATDDVPDTILPDIGLITSYKEALTKAFQLDSGRMPEVLSFFSTTEGQSGLKVGELRVPLNLKVFLDRAFYSVIDQASSLPEVLDTHRYAGGIAKECRISCPLKNGKTAHLFVAMPVTEMFWQLWQANTSLMPEYSLRYEFNDEGLFLSRLTASVVIGNITFSKTYPLAYLEQEQWRNLCTAGVWPRQKIAAWEDYYLFCNEIGGYRLEPEEEVAPKFTRCYPKNAETEGDITFYKLKSAPDHCRLKKNSRDLGYLKIRKRTEIPKGGDQRIFRASIDFGTSATTLYGSVNDSTAARINGVNLWSLPLINTVDANGHDASRLERYFIPPLPQKNNGGKTNADISTPTSLDFEALQGDFNELNEFPTCVPMQTVLLDTKGVELSREVFLDSWIYFRSFLQLRDSRQWPDMHTNLKWAHAKDNDHNRIETMLTEILLMLSLEARSQSCGKIAITASYPLSFSDATREDYFTALNTMFKVILTKTGLKIQYPDFKPKSNQLVTDDMPLVDRITESEAVFRFSIRQDEFNENYFVVDVGGGSTDIFISLINNEHHRDSFSTSLEFGARRVLIDKLLHNKENLLKEVMSSFTAELKEYNILDSNNYIRGFANRNKSSMVEDMFSMRVPRDNSNPTAGLLPKTFGEAFMKSCAGNTTQKAHLELKKRIAFYLGAAIWLSGTMLKGKNPAGEKISLLFTGNGSKMIRWLSTENDRIRHFVYLILKHAGSLALPKEGFAIRFTAMPKEEVAFGALLPLPEEFYEVGQKAPIQVAFDLTEQKKDTFEEYKRVHYEMENIKTCSTDFAKYLEVFKKACVSSFNWRFEDDEYEASIIDSVGFKQNIEVYRKKHGYFLSALEAVSARYMPVETKNESN